MPCCSMAKSITSDDRAKVEASMWSEHATPGACVNTLIAVHLVAIATGSIQ